MLYPAGASPKKIRQRILTFFRSDPAFPCGVWLIAASCGLCVTKRRHFGEIVRFPSGLESA
jgi:hypothetical protein